METLKKLQQARKKIKETKIKKEGYNTFSKYAYFTPSQISQLVHQVSEELKLFNKFDLKRTELGLIATLEIHDLETKSEPVVFEIATDIPEIKATNIAQQLGGCVTYSERYLLQIAYDIVDNSLDFDADKPQEKKPSTKPTNETKSNDVRPWMSEEIYNEAITKISDMVELSERQEAFTYLDMTYKMKNDYRAQLTTKVATPLF